MKKEFSTLKILVVDDTAFTRASLIKMLIGHGVEKFNITEAENGNLAYAALKARPYDLVISDLNMPMLSGLELLKKVRTSKESFKSIPFMLSTTDSEKKVIIEAISFQVSDYMLKPVSESILLEKLTTIFPGPL